jgi:beta-lactamase regulating signal transducer with metallopeptidase domain
MVRFLIWATGFGAVLLLPFLPSAGRLVAQLIGLSSPAQASAIQELSSTVSNHPLLYVDSRWSIALALLWAAVSFYRATDLTLHCIRLRKLWKSAEPILFDELTPSLRDIPAIKLRGRKPVQICTTEFLDKPSVIGFFAPRILIPAWLLPRLSPGELQQILLHESEHLRRADDWTNLLQKLSLMLFPLNPVLYWMERQLCIEREMACDEAVVRITRAPRAYAACLTSLAERGIQRRTTTGQGVLSLGVWQRRSELVLRVHGVLRYKPAIAGMASRAHYAALALALIFGSIELSRSPQLVSFVPASSLASVSDTNPKAQLAEFNALVSTRAGARPYLTSFRTAVPMTKEQISGDSPAETRYPSQTKRSDPTRFASRQTVSHSSPRETVRSNEEYPDLENEASLQPGQSATSGSFVMTAWEEVSATSYSSLVPAEVESANNDTAPAQRPNRQSGEVSQFTLTRVVFQVVPAISITSPSAAFRMRNGWLVIQL